LATLIAVSVSLILTGWFVMSVIAQAVPRVHYHLGVASRFGLIPSWRFFAPNPATSDTHLFFRDRSADRTVGSLRPASTIASRHWHQLFWNPSKFHDKVITDVSGALLQHSRELGRAGLDDRLITLSTPYLALLHLAMRAPHRPESVARQFILADETPSANDAERRIVFVSGFHCFDSG
jgi:hypothetical protein